MEILFFDGCPSWQSSLENVQTLIAADHLPLEVRLVEIHDDQEAQSEHFLGSPSFRLDGVDLWPETRKRYNMSCRVYQTGEGMRGSPSIDMLRDKISTVLP